MMTRRPQQIRPLPTVQACPFGGRPLWPCEQRAAQSLRMAEAADLKEWRDADPFPPQAVRERFPYELFDLEMAFGTRYAERRFMELLCEELSGRECAARLDETEEAPNA